jgi:hypothetical protein
MEVVAQHVQLVGTSISENSQDRCDRAETGDCAYTKRHEAFIRRPYLISTALRKTILIDEWYCCRGRALLELGVGLGNHSSVARSFPIELRRSLRTVAIIKRAFGAITVGNKTNV